MQAYLPESKSPKQGIIPENIPENGFPERKKIPSVWVPYLL
jgi:hypothetical protein